MTTFTKWDDVIRYRCIKIRLASGPFYAGHRDAAMWAKTIPRHRRDVLYIWKREFQNATLEASITGFFRVVFGPLGLICGDALSVLLAVCGDARSVLFAVCGDASVVPLVISGFLRGDTNSIFLGVFGMTRSNLLGIFPAVTGFLRSNDLSISLEVCSNFAWRALCDTRCPVRR